ncbi:MAG: ferritin family protein [Candidatus Omnitrophota bacterium]
MAMQVEQQGMDFYNYLGAYHQKLSKLFLYLAKQEENHCFLFQQMAEQMKAEAIEKEYSIDVKSMLRESFDGLEETAFSIKKLAQNTPIQSIDMRQFFSIAIDAEEQSIDVYQHIQESFTDDWARILSSIIKEEHKHRNILLRFKKEAGIST